MLSKVSSSKELEKKLSVDVDELSRVGNFSGRYELFDYVKIRNYAWGYMNPVIKVVIE